jgi:hypothetical protein
MKLYVPLGGLVVSVLATGPKVRGFKPGFATRCLLALLTDVLGGRIRWLGQVDRGADNPTSYIPNYHETRKGGQGPIQGFSATKKE